MIKIDLWSAKEEELQSFGGAFRIKEVQSHPEVIELSLEPESERRTTGRFERRNWRRAKLEISIEDIPQVVLAVVAQLSRLRTELARTLGEVAGRNVLHDIYDGDGDRKVGQNSVDYGKRRAKSA